MWMVHSNAVEENRKDEERELLHEESIILLLPRSGRLDLRGQSWDFPPARWSDMPSSQGL